MAQRAFAQKLSKHHATDVRKNVTSYHLTAKSESSSAASSSISLSELVEPLDYEDFLVQHSSLLCRDALRHILDFPPCDVQVRTIPRKIRTVDYVVPKEDISTLPIHVQECVDTFVRPWKVVEFAQRNHSSSCFTRDRLAGNLGSCGLLSPGGTTTTTVHMEFEIDREFYSFDDTLVYRGDSSCTPSSRQSIASLSSVSSCTDTLTPRGSWASFDLRSSVNDPLLPGLLDRTAPEALDAGNERRRMDERQPALFRLFGAPDLDVEDFGTERRLPAEMPVEPVGHRILIKCLQLKLELEVEPIFASMAIYDAKERKKISENFYFDMNADGLKRMLQSHVPFSDASTQSRAAVFEITNASSDLFLVIRLEKVLQGDLRDSVEPYMKEDKDKYRDKAKNNAEDFCERLGKYRMPFAWTGIYLTNIFTGDSMDKDETEDRNSMSGSGSNSGLNTSAAAAALVSSSTLLSSSSSGGVSSAIVPTATGAAVATTGASQPPATSSTGSTTSLDRKASTSSFDQLRRRATDSMGGTISRRGSLDRGGRSGGAEKRRSLSPDDFANSIETFRPIAITVSSFFKQDAERMKDDDLYKFLPELKRPGTVIKKYKCIPGTLKLDIAPCPDELRNALTAELVRVEPYSAGDKQRPVKEVLEFPSAAIFTPHYCYRNLLFVSPKELNFSARAGSARNIAVRMQVMEGERQEDAIRAIFAKSSCPEWASEAYTAVNYHNKCPAFYDELKVALPADLRQNHHILFTLYHVSCQKKPLEVQASVETPVGFTWLPILKDGKLNVGEFNLPVMVEQPPENYSFIPPDVQLPGTKWLDNHRPVFAVNIDAVTSVHTLDAHLDQFLQLSECLQSQKIPPRIGEANIEREMKKAMSEIQLADLEQLVKNLTLVLDKLIELLVQPVKIGGQSLSLGPAVFETICLVSRKVQHLTGDDSANNELNSRHPLLSTYVQFQCKIPHPLSDGSGRRAVGEPGGDYLERGTSNPSLYTMTEDEYGRTLDRSTSNVSARSAEHQLHPTAAAHPNAHQPPMPPYPPATAARHRPVRLLHEELALHWVVNSNDLSMANSWFLCELIVKSMIEHLDWTSQLNAPRKQRFPHQFTDDLQTVVHLMTTKVVGFHSSGDLREAQSLNNSIAFLLFDLLAICDRGFVFGLVNTYNKVMISKVLGVPDLTHYKLDFLRIVCSHEHFVALNLPFGTPYTAVASAPCSPTPSVASNNSQTSYLSTMASTDSGGGGFGGSGTIGGGRAVFADLSPDFRQQHFLAGLMLGELATVLELASPPLHGKAIRSVRNLLASHDLDPRLAEADVRARVAVLYLPLLGIVMDALPQLHQFAAEGATNFGVLEDYQGPSSRAGGATAAAAAAAATISPEVAYAISGSRVYSFAAATAAASAAAAAAEPLKNKSPLSSENTRHLLACFAWVLKNVERSVLFRWAMGLRPHRVHQLLQVVNVCIPCYEYRGRRRLMTAAKVQRKVQSFRKHPDMKERLEECIRGTGSARQELMQRRKSTTAAAAAAAAAGTSASLGQTPTSSTAAEPTEKLRWRKDQMPYRSQYAPPTQDADGGDAVGDNLTAHHVEGSLATEVCMVLLDTLEIIVQVATNSELHHNLLGTVLKVLLHALSRNQSTFALQNLFATQRSMIFKFHHLLFDDETDRCADLCLLLLKHCGSQLPSIRSQAAASLYLLMRQNFEIGNNFARVKMQVTMSLSSLVGTSSSFSEQSLRRALKTILVYAEGDAELQETTFPEQVQDLLFNLHMILSDTVKMKEYQEDPEMLLDLMHRIAKGYQNNPDLRLTWLENMAKKHAERGNHTEAAMCYVHSAALVAEYLSMLESQTHLPVGAVSLKEVTPNALMESAVSDDVLSPGEDGICLGSHFTETGLKALVEEAANAFQIAGMYEAMNNVYKVLVPICEANRDFMKLAKIHGKLQEAFNRITQLHGKRVFGTYFRVGFYGQKFGDLDQQEFIYKEPTLTKLPEIFSRLQNFYADRYGADMVDIIKDSNTVDVNTLDPEKAYIQITYVEPYFETYELRYRETYFERNFNIMRFIFATPFTKTGKAHGELHEQCKRKTILTAANHFPYVKTRIQVVHRKQIILEPIEVAIEDIQKKTIELAAATNQEPSDPKILQMVLQGCIGTTVNQGPMEMAMVFLGGIADSLTVPTRHQNKLRLCFKDFSKKCHDALKKNKNLIGSDQKDYQKELERNYAKFTERLAPLIVITPAQASGVVSASGYNRGTPLRW